MTEKIIETVTTPGAIALVLIWMNARMNRVESRLDMMADHAGAPRPKKRAGLSRLWLAGCVIGAIVLTGCAGVVQTMQSSDGATTASRVFAIWPATGAVEKATAKQTKTTQALGLESAIMDGGSTNLVTALTELRRILEMLPK